MMNDTAGSTQEQPSAEEQQDAAFKARYGDLDNIQL